MYLEDVDSSCPSANRNYHIAYYGQIVNTYIIKWVCSISWKNSNYTPMPYDDKIGEYSRPCSHKSIHSKSKIDKSQKDDIKFVIAGKNTAKTLDATKKSLNLITLFVQFLIVVPRTLTIALWRNNRHIARLHSQSSRLVPLISPVHQEVNRMVHRTELLQKGTAFWTVATVSRRQRKDYPIPIRCGDHMKFGVPSTPCSSDGLRPVFFKAPIPSG